MGLFSEFFGSLKKFLNKTHPSPVFRGMSTTNLLAKFAELGARAKFRPLRSNRWNSNRFVLIDIGNDRRGEFFDIQAAESAELEVLDVQPRDRHLLLMSREPAISRNAPETKSKFLCGHDERSTIATSMRFSLSRRESEPKLGGIVATRARRRCCLPQCAIH